METFPIISFRKEARQCKWIEFAHRNEAVKACKRLGHIIWKCWLGYYRRSLVEAKINCIKRLGEKVTSGTFEQQVVELNICASIPNIFNKLGRRRR